MDFPLPISESIYIRCLNSGVDWTGNRPMKVLVSNKEKTVSYDLSLSDGTLKLFLSYFTFYCTGSVILGWNLKPIYSALKYFSKHEVDCQKHVFYDLSIIQDYISLGSKAPVDYVEACKLMKDIVKNDSWEEIKPIYLNIYKKLIGETIPAIESLGITNKKIKNIEYCFYDFENLQVNGRLRSEKNYRFGFNPHSIFGEEDCDKYIPKFFDYEFLYFDYKYMEVSFLSWLSKDKNMKSIIDSGDDFYEGVWKLLFDTTDCSPVNRKRCKSFFLPIFYGLGAKALGERLNVNTEIAQKLINRINSRFHQASGWLSDRQGTNLDYSLDFFKRKRYFQDGEKYKIRNFSIQSPASLFCLHKLNEIVKILKKHDAYVAMHIHDGYVIVANQGDRERVSNAVVEEMTKPDQMFEGLTMKTSVKFGRNLLDLKNN